MRSIVWVVVFLISACSGLEMRTLRPDEVSNARKAGGSALNGYIVYEPAVVVEISIQQVCIGAKDDKGACKGPTVVQCAAGAPFLLPDYDKPYSIATKSGLGKAGVELTITDGWRLGGVKDNSDNTAILSLLEKAAGIKTEMVGTAATGCKAPGLYRVILDSSGIGLKQLLVY